MERLTTNIVPAYGPLDAQIAFIGEAPGEEEDRSLEPFYGSAGQFHIRCLKQVELSKQEVIHHNIFCQRPPRNDINYFFQDAKNTKPTWEGEEHIEQFRQWLSARVGTLNLVVALGATAMYVLTGKKRITKWRGSVLPCTLVPGLKVYCMNHPSWVLRLINEPEERTIGPNKQWRQNALPLYLIDLKRVVEQSSFPEIKYQERVFDISLSFQELCARLAMLRDMESGTIGVDIETLPGIDGPIVWCIGFSPSPDYAFVVPIVKGQRLFWTVQEEAQLWRLISQIFLNNTKKVFQGGSYDLSILGRYYGLRVHAGTYEDTMLCHHAAYPYLKKALETLTSIYTWEPYYKDEGKVHDGKRSSDEGEFLYNAKDCAVTREILPITHRNARELGFWSGYRRTLSVFPSHLGMMLRGIRVDMKAKDLLGQEFSEKANFYQDKIKETTGISCNAGSNNEIQRILYGYYNMPVQYNHKTKRVSVDKDAIARLTKRYTGQGEEALILDCITNYRKFSKLASTYTGMEVDSDGRIHTTYSWVSTFRTASSESPFGSGGNLQNIPVRTEEGRMVRRLFIPDEGMVFLAGDYSQAEARVVDWEAENFPAMAMYASGADAHWEKARITFQIPGDVVYNSETKNNLFKDKFTKQEHPLHALRRLSKTIKHAGNYGEGPVRLQNTLAVEGFYLELSTCKALLAQAQRADPFTVEWQRKIREKIRASRELTSSFGRKRKFLGRLNDNLWRSAYAFSPQNTVGEVLQVALQAVWSILDYLQVLLNKHDEIMVQCKPEDLEKARDDMRDCMTIPLLIHERELIIPVDFQKGPNWGDLEDWK